MKKEGIIIILEDLNKNIWGQSTVEWGDEHSLKGVMMGFIGSKISHIYVIESKEY